MSNVSLRRIGSAAFLILLSSIAIAFSGARERSEPIRFDPYENESEVLCVGPELTIENRLDRVTIIGSVDLTLDQAGVRKAEALRVLLDRVCKTLHARKPLPEQVATEPAATVANPFE